MASTAYLSLGSNVGDRLETLTSALFALHETDGIAVEETSGVYETAPWGGVEQDPFLNLAVRIRTTLDPHALLAELHLTEAAFGRERDAEQRWGPRTLDIDLLLYDDLQLSDDELRIPHPRMTERVFVLVPLLEIMPGGRLPDGERLTRHLQRLAPVEGIELVLRLEEVPGSAGVARPEAPGGGRAYSVEEWRPDGGAR